MKKLAIFGNGGQHEHLHEIIGLLDALEARHIPIVVEQDFERYIRQSMPGRKALPALDASQGVDADAALSLGGDGTFLTTVMWVGNRELPIMGVNTGHLGYLTACNIAQAVDAVEQLQQDKVLIDRRTMLQVDCDVVDINHPYALNDVAILRKDSTAMLEMETSLDGQPLTTYKADGLVICTPTGSTAYNLSAGGPILAPSTPCLAISPLSPHSLTMRPMVVPDTAAVTIATRSRATHFHVSLDGEAYILPIGATVTVRKAPFSAHVVQLPGQNFAATLRHKLHWGL